MARKGKRWSLTQRRKKKLKSKKTVLKTVPARLGDENSEQVGEVVFYEDGSMDIIQFADISDEGMMKMAEFRELMSKDYGDAIS